MQGDKSWILPKEINANRFFWDSHWLEIWKKTTYGPLWDRMDVHGYGIRGRYNMNGRFQMQGGKNWILPKEINANRFFWDAQCWKSGKNHLLAFMGPNGGSVAMDSEETSSTLKVHKIEIFFGFDFEICIISLLVMWKY
jgi:hypothetical protein